MITAQILPKIGASPVGNLLISDVPSIAALRAIVTGSTTAGADSARPAIEDGSIANVTGFAAQNDGGGGTFIFSAYSVSADDGGNTIAPTNGLGRWIRQAPASVNVRSFGAVGDGVADDTAAIQAALNSGAKLVIVPKGTYNQSAALNIPANVKLRGDGFGSTIFTQITPATDNFTVIGVDNASIENIGINAVSAVAIHVKSTAGADVSSFTARDVYIFSLGAAGIGVHLEPTAAHTIYFTTLDNVTVKGGATLAYGTKVGYKIGAGVGMVSCVGTRIFSGRIWRCHIGVHLNNCDTTMSFGLAQDDCDAQGVYFDRCGGCLFYATRQEAGTFGKYAEFTANGNENFFESSGIESSAAGLLTDAGIRNSWQGSNGSGGLIDSVAFKKQFKDTITLASALMSGTLNNLTVTSVGAIQTPRAVAPANSAATPAHNFGGTTEGTAPGGGALTHSFLFPFNANNSPQMYLAVASFVSAGDATNYAHRTSLFIETVSGTFVEANLSYVHPGAGTLALACVRAGNDVQVTATAAAATGVAWLSRSFIRLN